MERWKELLCEEWFQWKRGMKDRNPVYIYPTIVSILVLLFLFKFFVIVCCAIGSYILCRRFLQTKAEPKEEEFRAFRPKKEPKPHIKRDF